LQKNNTYTGTFVPDLNFQSLKKMASASHQNHFSYYFINVTYVYPDDTGAQTETMSTCFPDTSYIKNEQIIPLIATKPQQDIANVKSVMQLFKLAMVKKFLFCQKMFLSKKFKMVL
jgi:hypothetical protein